MMMNFLEKSRDQLVHFLFPAAGRFYPVISLVLILAVWSVPETYWPVRSILMWLWLVNGGIHFAGIFERDYFPVQPGNGAFYRIYRFSDSAVWLFLLLWLILIPGPSRQVKMLFGVVIVAVWILRAVGDRKYRPKKPEE